MDGIDELQGFAVAAQGMALGLGLIVAIGAQNAFVLRQGLRREHVGAVVLLCAAADALLIAAGVLGLGRILAGMPQLAQWLALGGAAFLAVYGGQALLRALRPRALKATSEGSATPRAVALAQAAAFTLLNPHVYLDTVVLVGGIGAQHPAALRGWFVAGACSASALWFTSLGYGARWLAPLFARPRAWQLLDVLIGATMWILSAMLLVHALRH